MVAWPITFSKIVGRNAVKKVAVNRLPRDISKTTLKRPLFAIFIKNLDPLTKYWVSSVGPE